MNLKLVMAVSLFLCCGICRSITGAGRPGVTSPGSSRKPRVTATKRASEWHLCWSSHSKRSNGIRSQTVPL
jgi:hypothetical protein